MWGARPEIRIGRPDLGGDACWSGYAGVRGRPADVSRILRRLDLLAAPLIILSAASVAVGGDLARGTAASWLDRGETALSVLFTAEYCYRLYLGRRRYAFSFFGVVDFLAGVPGLLILAGGQELLALRVLRLFRLLALLKLGRYGRAAMRLGTALRSVREEFALLGATAEPCSAWRQSEYGTSSTTCSPSTSRRSATACGGRSCRLLRLATAMSTRSQPAARRLPP